MGKRMRTEGRPPGLKPILFWAIYAALKRHASTERGAFGGVQQTVPQEPVELRSTDSRGRLSPHESPPIAQGMPAIRLQFSSGFHREDTSSTGSSQGLYFFVLRGATI
jgi:hypothetical protein